MVNILAPATVEQHLTFGVSRKTRNDNELSLAVMYAPEKTISGPNTFDPTQFVELTMSQWELELSWSW